MPDNVRTERLTLIPLSAEAAQQVTLDRAAAAALLGVRIPDAWPHPDLLDFLPIYTLMLRKNPAEWGWGIWLIVYRGTVIGDIGFKGQPDKEGMVENRLQCAVQLSRAGLCVRSRPGIDRVGITQQRRSAYHRHLLREAHLIRVLEKIRKSGQRVPTRTEYRLEITPIFSHAKKGRKPPHRTDLPPLWLGRGGRPTAGRDRG